MIAVDDRRPLVSVVIPCYHGGRFIGQALASVASQTYRPIEAVVVDDGSTDDSASVAESFDAPGVSVRVIRSDANRGIPTTRNLAIEHAEGELVAFLDQDDLWLPHKIDTQVRALRRRDPDVWGIACSDIYVQDLTGDGSAPLVHEERATTGLNDLAPTAVLARLLERNFISSVTAVVSKEAIRAVGGFDPDLTGGADDWDLWLRVAEEHPLVYVPEPLAIYRVHGNNYTALGRMQGDEKRILDFWEERRPDLIASVRRSRARMTYHRACRAFADQEWSRAARQARSAVRTSPLTPHFWPLLVKSTLRSLVPAPPSRTSIS